jgi:hypothetical protein
MVNSPINKPGFGASSDGEKFVEEAFNYGKLFVYLGVFSFFSSFLMIYFFLRVKILK